jgi:hypothetical protein
MISHLRHTARYLHEALTAVISPHTNVSANCARNVRHMHPKVIYYKAGKAMSPCCSPIRLDAVDRTREVMRTTTYVMEPYAPGRCLCAVGLKYVRIKKRVGRKGDDNAVAGVCVDTTKMLRKSRLCSRC